MFQQGPADLVSGPIFGGLKCMWFLVVEAPKSALFCVACGVHDTLATQESGLWCGSRRVGGWYCFCQHAPSDGLQGMSACHVASYYFHTERIVPVVVLKRAGTAGRTLAHAVRRCCMVPAQGVCGQWHVSSTPYCGLCVTRCAYAAHVPYRVAWSPVQCMMALSSSRRRLMTTFWLLKSSKFPWCLLMRVSRRGFVTNDSSRSGLVSVVTCDLHQHCSVC